MSKAPNVPLFPVCHVAFICSCFLKKPQDKKLYIRNAIDDLPNRSQKGSSKKEKGNSPWHVPNRNTGDLLFFFFYCSSWQVFDLQPVS